MHLPPPSQLLRGCAANFARPLRTLMPWISLASDDHATEAPTWATAGHRISVLANGSRSLRQCCCVSCAHLVRAMLLVLHASVAVGTASVKHHLCGLGSASGAGTSRWCWSAAAQRTQRSRPRKCERARKRVMVTSTHAASRRGQLESALHWRQHVPDALRRVNPWAVIVTVTHEAPLQLACCTVSA